MAYGADDWRIIVEGTIALSEMWSNTWTVHDTVGGGNPQDAVDALQQFYNDLDGFLGASWHATNARYRNLSTNIETVATWPVVDGTAGTALLPSQVAMRVSLNSLAGVNGGPFLSGWAAGVVDADDTGSIADATQASIATAVSNLNSNLSADDWEIGIDRPTQPEVVRAVRARIGKRFDIIRKRANDLPESYSSVSL